MKKNISEKNNRGLVLTLIPTHAQKLLLDKHLNDTRYIYNKYVEEYLKALNEDRAPKYKSYKELCTEYEFLKSSYSWSLQQVDFQFTKTNKINRTKRSKGQKVGLVRFKSKKAHNDHYYVDYIRISYNHVGKSESYIHIPIVGKVQFLCKNIKSEFLKGKIKHGVIKRTKTGAYTISLCIEINKVHEDCKDNKHIGLDFSLKDFLLTVLAQRHQGFQRRDLKWNYFVRRSTF